jgi:hypothetical protein
MRRIGRRSPILRRMKYYHWASNPVRLRKRNYPQSGHPKPHGLWFDVNEDWKRWCDAAQFSPENLHYRHSVTILDKSRILFLKKAKEIDEFTQRYGHNMSFNVQPLQKSEDLDGLAHDGAQNFFIDVRKAFSNYIMWGEVAEKHSGIIISPYFRSRSQTYLWYWGWSCAGGCVWDTSILHLGEPCRMIE